MRRLAIFLAQALCLCAITVWSEPQTLPAARPLTNVKFERTPQRIARGKYLAEGLLQCFNCHSDRDWSKPGAPAIASKRGAGHIFHNESDYFLAAPNITPDVQTGAGSWSDDMLARAIREGIGHDGRALHPQMWYDSFRFLTDEDVASVVIFLRTIPAISRSFPPRKLPPERAKAILNNPKPVLHEIPRPSVLTAAGRGEYLVGIADCVGCHTAFEAPKMPGFFAGGNEIDWDGRKVFSPNITPDPTGISYYNADLFIETMRTGKVHARELSPIMPWWVFRNLTDSDLRDMFAYLQSLTPVRHAIDNTTTPLTFCPACGQKHGQGERNHAKIVTPAKIDPSKLADYAGHYTYPDGTPLDVTFKDNKLFVNFGQDIELLPVGTDVFDSPDLPSSIHFLRDPKGVVIGFDDSGPYGKGMKVSH